MSTPAEDSRSKAVAFSMAANVAGMGMAGVASVLAARLLGPQGRGQFAAIIVWASLAAALGDLGISQSCSYYSARRPQEAGRIAATSITLSITAAAVLVALLQFFGGRIFGGEAAAAAKLYLFSVPISMAVTCLTAMMLGLGYFGRFNLIKTVQAAGYVAGIGSAWAAGSMRVGGMLTGILVFQALGGLVALGCAATVIPLATWRVSVAMSRELLSYGIRTYAGNLCWLANGRLDQALLAWLVPMQELGIYAVAVSYSGLQFGVSGAIATVAFSRAARASSSEARRQELWRGLNLFTVLTLPLAAVMALLARSAITAVYGVAFAGACTPACILLLGGLFLGANYVSSNCMRADGRPGSPVLAEAGGLVVTVLALPFVLPRWGITGAAWVSAASYAATAAILAVLWMLHGKALRAQCPIARESGIPSEAL
ncbi:MAG TPA: oligosaccharide flippase family protein [Bryobacteraceae bacterium]|nr:oligosaccharide flippase family protein [Bryobacteraceae bacterium]